MTSPLAGRRALVTGGSRGIGAEIVRRLAADGAAVAFTYGSSAVEAEKLAAEVAESGGNAVAIPYSLINRLINDRLDPWACGRNRRSDAASSSLTPH
jgi:NAD(P)-dependent dehydrogenase (short-subunit alcohol dehydrogenase family)